MADWFTSDTHAYHTNIMNYSKRPWTKVEDMNAALAENINRLVAPNDRLYHLGDFAFGREENVINFRDMITCQDIVFIYGNHDKLIRQNQKLRKLFSSVHEILEISVNFRKIVLCHYAMLTWNKQRYDSFQLYGHSHGSLPDNPKSLSIDVGVDTRLYNHTPYTPYSVQEIFNIMSQKTPVAVDHHVKH